MSNDAGGVSASNDGLGADELTTLLVLGKFITADEAAGFGRVDYKQKIAYLAQLINARLHAKQNRSAAPNDQFSGGPAGLSRTTGRP